MPKVKTHSGAKKRFKKLKSGLFKAGRPLRRHLLTKKSAKRKRQLRGSLYIGTQRPPPYSAVASVLIIEQGYVPKAPTHLSTTKAVTI